MRTSSSTARCRSGPTRSARPRRDAVSAERAARRAGRTRPCRIAGTVGWVRRTARSRCTGTRWASPLASAASNSAKPSTVDNVPIPPRAARSESVPMPVSVCHRPHASDVAASPFARRWWARPSR